MTVKNAVKLLVIDDHRLFVDGLALVLGNMSEVAKVETANSAQEFLKDVSKLSRFDLILVDLQMPGLDGFAFLTAMNAQQVKTPVAVLSGVQALKDIERVMQLGACGFVPKSSSAKELQTAVRDILQGKKFLPEDVAGRIDLNLSAINQSKPNTYHDKVGPRQLQVLELLREGQSNKQIALVLGVTESAVKSHVSILFNVLQVNNRTACVQTAINLGVLP